jgi:hypothetical protein
VEEIMERTSDLTTTKVLTAASLALVTSAGWANDGWDAVRFQGTLQATSKVFLPPEGRCKGPTLKAVGAGDTNLFGSVYIEQCHCLGPSGTFFDGFFKLTKNPPPLDVTCQPWSGSLVEGRYCGKLKQTFNSTLLPTTPPTLQGTWLIEGRVCITKTILGKVQSECGQPTNCSSPPRGYDPARGLTDVTANTATIFIDQWIRFK